MEFDLGTLRFFGLVVLVAAMAGCQSGGGFPGLGLGSNDEKEAGKKPDDRISQVDLRAYCPRVRLRQGTAFYNTYQRVRGEEERNPDNIVYQASISDVTRSCRYENGLLNMNIAVAGRVVPGPKAETGAITMPIRIAVVRGEEVLYSELHRHRAVIDGAVGATQFVFNDPDVSLPAPAAANLLVFAGYDEGSPERR